MMIQVSGKKTEVENGITVMQLMEQQKVETALCPALCHAPGGLRRFCTIFRPVTAKIPARASADKKKGLTREFLCAINISS